MAARDLGLAGKRDRPPAAVETLHGDLGAEVAQHQFAVIPGRPGLDDAGRARRVEARQQHRRLHLGRGHGKLVNDGQGTGGAPDHQWQAVAGPRADRRAHAPEGGHHPVHGPRRQRGVAGEEAGEGMGGQKPHEEPRPGAGVAHIENRGRFRQTADAASEDVPDAVGVAVEARAQGAKGVHGAQHVVCFQQAGNAGLAHGHGTDDQGAV